MRHFSYACILVGLALTATLQPALSQSSRPQTNAQALRGYLQPYAPSKLEWELMRFNQLWTDSYAGSTDYLTSFPVFFDFKAMQFRATFRVSERRDYRDPEPWSQLSRVKRESLLQGAVNNLRDLLGQSFPEIKSRPELLLVEFKYSQAGGGAVNAARFENGALVLVE